MATQVNPDDPNATGAARLQSMVQGARTPGSPSMAGKPDVQAGRVSFPAPPGLNTAPPGRPAQPNPLDKSRQPGAAPAPGASTPSAAAPSAATPSPQPGSPQPASGAASSQTAGTGAPAPPPAPPDPNSPGGMATQTFSSPTLPPEVGVGTQVQTPQGTVSSTPQGQRLALSPEGQMQFKEKMAQLRGRFTVPKVMKGMQGLPQMDLKLGASNFDPFGGRFHGRDE